MSRHVLTKSTSWGTKQASFLLKAPFEVNQKLFSSLSDRECSLRTEAEGCKHSVGAASGANGIFFMAESKFKIRSK